MPSELDVVLRLEEICEMCKGTGKSHDERFFKSCMGRGCHQGKVLNSTGRALCEFISRHMKYDDMKLSIRN